MKRINKDIGYVDLGKGSIAFNKNLFYEFNVNSVEEAIYFYINKGKEINKEHIELFRELIISSCFTDPRLWPNRVAGYCGSRNTTQAMALAASSSSNDGKFFGIQPVLRSYRFIKYLIENDVKKENILEEIKSRYGNIKRMPGFSRVFNDHDDRVTYMIEILKKTGFIDHPYIQKTKDLQDVLFENYEIKMNVAFLSSVILYLIGMNDEKAVASMVNFGFTLTSIPSFIDAMETGDDFIKIEDHEIEYSGIKNLKW
jgi:hypothetical protein